MNMVQVGCNVTFTIIMYENIQSQFEIFIIVLHLATLKLILVNIKFSLALNV